MSVSDEGKTPQAIWDELEAEDRAAQATAPDEPAPKPVEVEPTSKAGESKPEPAGAQPSPLEKQVAELSHLVKTTMGRVGSLQSEMQKIGTMAASRVADAPTQKQIDVAATDPEKWKQMKSDFPDWGEAIDEFVSNRIRAVSSVDEQGIARVAKGVTDTAVSRLVSDTAEDLLDAMREAWRDELVSPEFKAWFINQPEHYRNERGSSTRASVVLRTLREFDAYSKAKKEQDAEQAKQQDAKTRRLAAAAMPSGSAPPPTKAPEDMTNEEYWNFLDEQDRRRAKP